MGFLLFSAAIVFQTFVYVALVVPVVCEMFLPELLFMLLYHFVYVVVASVGRLLTQRYSRQPKVNRRVCSCSQLTISEL